MSRNCVVLGTRSCHEIVSFHGLGYITKLCRSRDWIMSRNCVVLGTRSCHEIMLFQGLGRVTKLCLSRG